MDNELFECRERIDKMVNALDLAWPAQWNTFFNGIFRSQGSG